MIKYFTDIEQGSDEWLELRRGILTASEVKKIITPTLKISSNEHERAHVYEMAAQRISGYVEPHYINDDMLRGAVDEIKAKIKYEESFSPIKECPFVTKQGMDFKIGYSPDGLVSDDGLIEIKSRGQKFQIETIVKNEVPKDYMLQIQTGLYVTERKWLDFISYSAGLPMFVKRVYPDVGYFEAIEDAAIEFESRVLSVMGQYHATLEDKVTRWVSTERDDNDELDIL